MLDNFRKCAICDCKEKTKSINIEEENYVRYKDKYYHIDCLILKEKSRKRKKKTDKELKEFIGELIKETKIFKKENDDKHILYKWLYENYNVSVLSDYLFSKISDINNGTYKGLNEGISSEDLLIIFKKMKDYLDKTAYKKRFKGQFERMNYDLAVVVSNYDKYKTWKRNQEKLYIDEEKQAEVIEDKKMYNKLINNKMKNKNIKTNTNNSNEKVDVLNIIDELF